MQYCEAIFFSVAIPINLEKAVCNPWLSTPTPELSIPLPLVSLHPPPPPPSKVNFKISVHGAYTVKPQYTGFLHGSNVSTGFDTAQVICLVTTGFEMLTKFSTFDHETMKRQEASSA